MVRKTLWVGIFASALMVVTVGAASAAPPVISLSSWESTVVDGQIVGGTRTIVITNITDSAMDAYAMDLGEAPCECGIASVSSGQHVSANTWSVPRLDVGETATVTLDYSSPSLRVPAVGSNSFSGPIVLITAMMVAVAGAGAAARRPRLALDF